MAWNQKNRLPKLECYGLIFINFEFNLYSSELIAFIVPAKYHTSWKVHKQLHPDFGLYFSEILPKNSFIKDDKPHNVNCCMQIWSKKKLGKNLRILKIPPTKHEDFDMFLSFSICKIFYFKNKW